jgi:hypothetical protein
MIMNTVSLANGKAAAKLISGNGISLVLETTLNDKIAYTNKLGVNCWSFERFTILTDPVGFGAVVTPITADNRTPNLVNNLDLKIIDNTGNTIHGS